MITSFKRAGYEQWIRGRGSHIDFNCSCGDFQMRKLKNRPTSKERKELIPCKHLTPLLEMTDLNFYVGYPWISGRSI